MRSLFFFLLAALTVCLPGRAQAQDTTARDVYKKAVPSIMVIVALDGNDQPLALGTGFYISRDLVATNLHVVRNAKKVRVYSATDEKERKLKGVHAFSGNDDLAVLRMEDAGTRLDPATDKLEPGDPVFAIGNPRGLEASLSTGIVSAVRKLGTTAMYQITAPISPGSSGGPVLNSKGQVIGVSTSYVDGGQNLNFAVDVKHLIDLIASNPKDTAQAIDVLSSAPLSVGEKRKVAVETIRVVGPNVFGGLDVSTTPLSHEITWDLSIKNDGDRPVKDFDVLILIFDKQSHDMIHFVRKKVGISVPAKLAKRTSLKETGLDFNTSPAGYTWEYEYRILDFQYDD